MLLYRYSMENLNGNDRKTKNHEYYVKNKARLQESYKGRVKCPLCDKNIAKSSFNNHLKSKSCEKGQVIKAKLISMGVIV